MGKNTKHKLLLTLSLMSVMALSGCALLRPTTKSSSNSEAVSESSSEVISESASEEESKSLEESSEEESEEESEEVSESEAESEEVSESEETSSEGSSEEESSEESSEDTSIHVESVTIVSQYDTINLKVGKSVMLNANIYPANADNKGLSWSGSDDKVATVSASGLVTGVAIGEVTVTVTSDDGGHTDSITVNVVANTDDDDTGEYVPEESADIFQITTEYLATLGELEEYEIDINQNYKQIYVNAPDAAIVLNLNAVTIENNENSPIYVADCDKLEISAKKKTTNNILDTRSAYTTDVTGQGKGAIYVNNGDLKLKGTGTLNIEAGYFNGIHGKDDVEIQKETLNITAINHAIRGNDSVSIYSGTINLSCGGDGIHTENSDVSSKGNQRGKVTINGGSITINSWADAIDASYDAIIEETDSEVPLTLDIATNKNSSYSGDVIETKDTSFYIRISDKNYSTLYKYAAKINGSWYEAVYKGSKTTQGFGGGGPGGPGGGSSTYHYYEIDKPNGASSFTLYRFNSVVATYSEEAANAWSDAKAFNDSYDTVIVQSINSNKINFGSWSNYESNGSISCKGIKAANEVSIVSGTVTVNAYDDAIHANADGTLENLQSPLGYVTISGGTITLSSADDAIHADNMFTITGGTINVLTAYEGIESNVVHFNGGTTTVLATDDGVNATSGKVSPQVIVDDGVLDVTVPTSGDTDGIDSNGTYTQNGGTVIVKGPGSASGNTMGAAALDTDGTVTISGGTIAIFGGCEQTPKLGSGVTKTLCSSSTVSTGSHTITFSSTSITTTLKYSTNGCVVYSSLGSATLK